MEASRQGHCHDAGKMHLPDVCTALRGDLFAGVAPLPASGEVDSRAAGLAARSAPPGQSAPDTIVRDLGAYARQMLAHIQARHQANMCSIRALGLAGGLSVQPGHPQQAPATARAPPAPQSHLQQAPATAGAPGTASDVVIVDSSPEVEGPPPPPQQRQPPRAESSGLEGRDSWNDGRSIYNL